MTCNMTWDTWKTSAFLLHSSQWPEWSCKCLTCAGDPARSWSSCEQQVMLLRRWAPAQLGFPGSDSSLPAWKRDVPAVRAGGEGLRYANQPRASPALRVSLNLGIEWIK